MKSITPVNVGVIGCGNISDAYFRATSTFPILNIIACADINPSAAQAKAEKWGIEALSVDALLARPDISIILNLTTPQAHAEVTQRALRAGKHVHLEKPLAVTRPGGQAMLTTAQQHNRRISCAPDTFLGGGLQTCRHLLDNDAIGRVVAGTAFMMCPGHESWHPNPGFYYLQGGGPVFDMAPYYLTALVHLLGPIRRVSSAAGQAYTQRTKPDGTKLPVEVPTHVAGTLDFHNGAIITLVMSFDVWAHTNHPIELHGTVGSMQLPDPNNFGGSVRIRKPGNAEWQDTPLTHNYTDNMRGIGAADLAYALATDRPHRCHSDLAFHVLDVMVALHESSEQGRHIILDSTCQRPAPLPTIDERQMTEDSNSSVLRPPSSV